jgi:hypothetical protein
MPDGARLTDESGNEPDLRAGPCLQATGLIATTGASSLRLPADPWKGAPAKANTPPSDATSQ